VLKAIKNRKNREKAKEIIFSKYFSSEKQKKVIMKAARESARDQRALVEKCNKIMAN
jgi:hypothetical protein